MSEDAKVKTAPTPAAGGGGQAGDGPGLPPSEGNAWDRFPTPAGVRAMLVRVLSDSGEGGLTDVEAERAVAEVMPALEDPLDADIDSLLILGVLKRIDGDRLRVTPLAAEYFIGAKVSV